MHPRSVWARIYITGWMFVTQLLHVAVVWVISLLSGVSTLGALALVSAVFFLFGAACFWFQRGGSMFPPTAPGGSSGDRVPRPTTPLPAVRLVARFGTP